MGVVMPYFCMFAIELLEVSIIALVFRNEISVEVRYLRKTVKVI